MNHMPRETLTYQVYREVRKGPFGLIRQREVMDPIPIKKLAGPFAYDLGSAQAVVGVMTDAATSLCIMSDKRHSLMVEFDADPARFQPKVTRKLDESDPQVRTDRRRVTIYLDGNPSERIIFEAPKFQPLMLTRDQVATMKSQYKSNPGYYNDPENFEKLLSSVNSK